MDDTLFLKWGHQIFGTSSFFDDVARLRQGYNWVVLAVIAELFGVPVALPFRVRLCRSKSSCRRKNFLAPFLRRKTAA